MLRLPPPEGHPTVSAPAASDQPPAPHPAKVIRGDLPSITLRDPGTDETSTVRLRASMTNVALIEERFGSIQRFAQSIAGGLQLAGGGLVVLTEQPLFGPITKALACLMPAGRFRDPDVLGDWLDPTDIGTYLVALSEVFAVAFPHATATPEATGDGQGNAPLPGPATATAPDPATVPQEWFRTTPEPTATDGSPGPISGTAPPSSSAAPTPSSGP